MVGDTLNVPRGLVIVGGFWYSQVSTCLFFDVFSLYYLLGSWIQFVSRKSVCE
jgi:hypothetical protein